MDILPTLGKVDAVVTDPPYGIGWKPRVTHQDQSWVDNKPFNPFIFLEIADYHLFWGAQYFADKLPISQSWCTWIKRPLAGNFDKSKSTFATTELAWSDWGKARFICQVWDGGMRAGKPENREFNHPSQKPIEVMEWCIPDDANLILDPYMGGGTTGVACANLGRKFIGIEKELKYFDIACERIDAAYAQGRLEL